MWDKQEMFLKILFSQHVEYIDTYVCIYFLILYVASLTTYFCQLLIYSYETYRNMLN